MQIINTVEAKLIKLDNKALRLTPIDEDSGIGRRKRYRERLLAEQAKYLARTGVAKK